MTLRFELYLWKSEAKWILNSAKFFTTSLQAVQNTSRSMAEMPDLWSEDRLIEEIPEFDINNFNNSAPFSSFLNQCAAAFGSKTTIHKTQSFNLTHTPAPMCSL